MISRTIILNAQIQCVAKMRFFFPMLKNAEHTVTESYAAKYLDSCNTRTLSRAPTSLGTLQLPGRGYSEANLMVSIALCTFNHTDTDYSVQNHTLFPPPFFKSYMFPSEGSLSGVLLKKILHKSKQNVYFESYFKYYGVRIFTIILSF